MKKKLLFLSFILIIIYSCSSKENKFIVKIKKNIIKINNKYTIDIQKSDKEILSNFGNYEENGFPFGVFYESTEYPIQLVYESEKNKISDFVLYFNLEKILYEYTKIVINDLSIDSNTKFEKIIDYLDSNKIKYNIEDEGRWRRIKPLNYIIFSVWYLKDNLNNPEQVRLILK